MVMICFERIPGDRQRCRWRCAPGSLPAWMATVLSENYPGRSAAAIQTVAPRNPKKTQRVCTGWANTAVWSQVRRCSASPNWMFSTTRTASPLRVHRNKQPQKATDTFTQNPTTRFWRRGNVIADGIAGPLPELLHNRCLQVACNNGWRGRCFLAWAQSTIGGTHWHHRRGRLTPASAPIECTLDSGRELPPSNDPRATLRPQSLLKWGAPRHHLRIAALAPRPAPHRHE